MVATEKFLAAVRQARSRPWHEIPWRTQRLVSRLIKDWVERARVKNLKTTVSLDDLKRALIVPLDDAVSRLGRIPIGRMSAGPEERIVAAARFKREHPDVLEALLAEAENACAHRFDLLGSGWTDLGPNIDWSCDFKTGFRWPRGYVKDMALVDLSRSADVKVPWDLSRGYQLVRLGQAFWLTGEERFASELMNQWRSWVAENPVLQTCNWGNAMEAAIRVCNWLVAFSLTRDSRAQTAECRESLLRAVLEHGRFIASNLERFEGHPTSNHYLSDLVGLVYLGILAPFFKESPKWLELGLSTLEKETLIQVGEDGLDYEGSINYHRLVGELLLSAFMLARQNGRAPSGSVWRRVIAMAEATLTYTRPDGRVPLIGDVDNGRLHALTPESPDDHRSFLGLAAAATGRSDFDSAAGRARAEGFWWGSDPSATVVTSPAPAASRLFESAGLAVLRSADAHVVVHCGAPRGPRGHFHNDSLGVEISLMNLAWIVDPGTYAYTSSEDDRNHFRRTAAHNTVQVDHAEINEIVPGALFDLRFASSPRVVDWKSSAQMDLFTGEHVGYSRLSGVGAHRRSVNLDKTRQEIEIVDLVEGEGTHLVEMFLHLDPAVRVERQAGLVVLRRPGCPGSVELEFFSEGAAPSITLTEDFVARGYGKRETGFVMRTSIQATLPWHQKIRIRAQP